jgi:dTMP kinase
MNLLIFGISDNLFAELNIIEMKKGTLIAFVGTNNIGKTTQVGLVTKLLKSQGVSVVSQKYPVYDLEPTGPRINDFLRNENPEGLSAMDFQVLCAKNRKDFEPALLELLNNNEIVIVEMYTESGIAFGMGDDLPKSNLIHINENLIKADLVILLDGERFIEAKEAKHYFEQNDAKNLKIRQTHLDLAKEFGWHTINANQSITRVTLDIVDLILLSFQAQRA